MQNPPTCYSVADTAIRLGVSPATVRALVKSGQLQAMTIGMVWRIDGAELARFMEGAKVQPTIDAKGTGDAAQPAPIADTADPE